jgi:hypothetical protein
MGLHVIRFVRLFLLVIVLTVAASFVAFGQSRPAGARPGTFTEIKWDGYVFKFLPGNQMGQVIDANGHLVATIMDYGGDLKLLTTLTGDAADKLNKSFQAWKDQGGEAALGYKTSAPTAGSGSTVGTPAKPALTVDGVISMLGAGISDDIIIDKIHKSGQSFDLSADDLVRLKKAKASDAVMKAMMDATPAPSPQPQTQTAAAVPPTSSPAAQPSAQPAAANSTASNKTPSESFGGSIKDALHSPIDIMHGKSVIDKVGLRNVLPQWDPQKPLSDQFPHIAITVLYAPTGWMDPYRTDKSAQGRSIVPSCFKLEAVVWSDADHSKKVGPFDWCSNKDEFLAVLEPDYAYSLIPRRTMGYNTGVNRTEGPMPPETLIPNDRATLDMEAKTNPYGRSIDLNHDNSTRFAMMFANVRKDLGETLTNDGDPRVWIVVIKKAAGPSLF